MTKWKFLNNKIGIVISALVVVAIITILVNIVIFVVTGSFKLSEAAKLRIIEREQYNEQYQLSDEEKKMQEEVIP